MYILINERKFNQLPFPDSFEVKSSAPIIRNDKQIGMEQKIKPKFSFRYGGREVKG